MIALLVVVCYNIHIATKYLGFFVQINSVKGDFGVLLILLAALETEQERHKVEELYEGHMYTCLHIAMMVCKNQPMAEDAVHNAFIEVIKNKEKYFELSHMDFRSKIAIIVKNKSIDLMRKEKKIADTSINELSYELDSNEIPIDLQVIHKIQYENLVKQISLLNDDSKSVFEMKYILNMTNAEIAEELGITKKNVEMKIYRAKLKLRKIIEMELEIS